MKIFYNWDGTDPSRYHHKAINREYFNWLFSMLAGTGLTFLYRANLAGRTYYHSQLMSAFDHSSVDHRNPDAQLFHRVADMMDGCDPLAEAVAAARRYGVEIWIWWNWNEFHCVRPQWLFLSDRLWYERPRYYWCSRDGTQFYNGVPDWGNPQVIDRLLGLAKETLNYDVDGMYLSTRSHSLWPGWRSPGWDTRLEPFGFNDSVVDTYHKRYGVDIRYEDYDEEKWLRIKGEQFSTVLAHTGRLIHDAGKKFIVGTDDNRYSMMADFGKPHHVQQPAPYLKLYKDWEAWAANGSIDGLCGESSCPTDRKLSIPDITVYRKTLGYNFPLYAWLDTGWWVNGDGRPFSLVNWGRNSVEQVIRQIELAREAQCAGAILHTLYHFTAVDSGGESIGRYGVLPRTEYFDALRQRA